MQSKSAENNRRFNLTNHINQKIIVNKSLITGLSIIKTILSEKDGKVVNINILKPKTDISFPSKVTTSLKNGKIEVSNFQERDYKTISGIAYISGYSYDFNIVFKDGNRLDAPATILNLDKALSQLKDSVTDCQTALTQFDEEYKDWNDIENKIDEYKKKYSSWIRGQIRTDR